MIEVAVVLGGILALFGLAYYFLFAEALPAPTKATSPKEVKSAKMSTSHLKEFTSAELAQYNGEGGKRIYIAIDGVVFDMSSHETGPTFYGPGGPYGVFAGRDATIGLATMKLDPADWVNKTVSDLSASEKDVAYDWVTRFTAKYKVVGSLKDGSRPSTVQQLKERNLVK